MTSPAPAPHSRRRFGPFEIDLASLELRRNGLRVRLPDQPARILEALLAHPGEMVSREALRERLWPADTFVDFERSLNAAVAKLRQALSDSAEQPRYIETVARRGYRFIAPVESGPPAAQAPPPAAPPPVAVVTSRKWKRIRLAAIAVGCALVGTAMLVKFREHPADPPPVRFVVHPPASSRIHPMSAISADGTRIAFVVVNQAGRRKLWLRTLASETAIALEDTDEAYLPFFSPDAQDIAFFAGGKLRRVSVAGGSAQTLSDARQPAGGAWSRDDVILFSQSGRLYRVSAAGGAATEVARPPGKPGERDIDTWPQFLPDGRRFIVSTATHNGTINATSAAIFLGSLDWPARTRLVATRGRAAVTESGRRLLFIRDYTLYAQALDLGAARLTGEPVAVARDLNRSSADVQVDVADGLPVGVSPAPFSVSANGVLVYHVSPLPLKRLAWFSRQGERLSVVGESRDYMQVFLSPNEQWAVVAIRNTQINWNLWLLNLQTNALSRLTSGDGRDADAAWGPGSDKIAYSAYLPGRGEQVDIMEIKLDERAPRMIYSDGYSNKPESWAPDGSLLLFRRNEQSLFALPISGNRKPAALLETPLIRHSFHFSPDGNWVAYASSETGAAEVYVCRFPEMTGVRQVSTAGGVAPLWRKDGRELFYMTMLGEVMAVDINAGPSVSFSAPKPLFRPDTKTPGLRQFGVADNGRKFFVIEEDPARSTEERMVVQTRWNASLSR